MAQFIVLIRISSKMAAIVFSQNGEINLSEEVYRAGN